MILTLAACTFVTDEAAQQRLDPDEDGVRWPHDCDDADPDVGRALSWYADLDADGFGDPADAVEACSQPPGRVTDATDCNDDNPNANVDGVEKCDDEHTDEDCNGVANNDDEAALGTIPLFVDADGDGSGSSTSILACEPGEGIAPKPGDCDDTDETVNPSASEVCDDGVDNDCDGAAKACRVGAAEMPSLAVVGTGFFGREVLIAPDLDGDGHDDLVAGNIDTQRVWVWRGPLAGTLDPSDAWATIEATDFFEDLGQSLTAGDLDGDGAADLVLGSDDDTNGWDSLHPSGAVTIAYGPLSAGITTDSGMPRVLGTLGSDIGADINSVGVGDLDNDDHDELVLGMQGYKANDRGAVAIMAGGARLIGDVDAETGATALIEGGQGNQHVGRNVDVVGDTNGDGTDDIVIGSEFAESSTGVQGGRVWIFEAPVFGTVPVSSATAEVLGSQDFGAGVGMGFVVSAAGDVNGDGRADMLLADNADQRYFIGVGPFTGSQLGNDLEAQIVGGAGILGGMAGDLDGDGFSDVVVLEDLVSGSKPWVLYGPITGVIDATAAGWIANDDAIVAVDGGRDISGDGLPDVALGQLDNRVVVLFGSGL